MDFRININDICGKNVVTRNDGKAVHDLIVREWDRYAKIAIDFGHVLAASVSFVDEIFGKLTIEFDRHEVQAKLQIVNIQEFDRALLNDILRSRYRQKEIDKKVAPTVP